MTSAARPLPHWLTVSTTLAPAAGDHGDVVDGRACRTRAAFFEEAARALRLPAYFGRNWDALADSLRDLTAAGKATLAIDHAEALLADEPPTQLAALLAILAEAAEAGLTVTLHTTPEAEPTLHTRLTAALN
ncbi:barstar family protein [Sphaerisporangium album]|uniref:barstar family protein n=1 Tax=Sphaerisporangium album TaxID=509200 RepID=UPI001C69389E|nr:barstar family protein [Sphaerisporangium album]